MTIIKSDKILVDLQHSKQSNKAAFFDFIIYEKN